MVDPLILFCIVIVLAIGFDFVNGFHDTANAIATVVVTRVMTPLQAIVMASTLNFAGAMTGTAVAKTIASGLVPPEIASHHQYTIVAALASAIIWNLVTWFYGIPSSSSHALIGGILGAAITATGSLGTPKWDVVFEKVILPLFLSPVIGFAFAWLITIGLLRAFIKKSALPVSTIGLKRVAPTF